MTFSLPKKRPITPHATNTSAPKAADPRTTRSASCLVALLALACLPLPVLAQNPNGQVVMVKALQRPRIDLPGPVEDMKEYQIQLSAPGPEKIFGRLETEKQLQERMRQEARERPTPERIYFPEEQPLSREKYQARNFAPIPEVVEPCYVSYRKLYFEDRNTERYGWDFGFVQPVVSTAKFWWDLAWFPYHLGTAPCRRFDTNAGQCMPGDPVPYMVYPPDLSVTGVAMEAGTVLALFAIFPGM